MIEVSGAWRGVADADMRRHCELWNEWIAGTDMPVTYLESACSSKSAVHQCIMPRSSDSTNGSYRASALWDAIQSQISALGCR